MRACRSSASYAQLVDVVCQLLRTGASPRVVDGSNDTPLTVACARGYAYRPLVLQLVAFGASARLALRLKCILAPDVWALFVSVDLWQSDNPAADVVGAWKPRLTRQPLAHTGRGANEEIEWTRRLRALLRPLVDPRARELRRTRFAESPLRLLPWHVAVEVLRCVVVRPIRKGWGVEEYGGAGRVACDR